MKVRLKKLHENAQIPILATKGSACNDLVATVIQVKENDKITVRTGLSMEIPFGYKLCIVPRSSISDKGWVIANSPCQIDSDYRGEIIVNFKAIPHDVDGNNDEFYFKSFPYKELDRFAQCYLEEVIPLEFEEVEVLSETSRGTGGFGSTGK